MTIEDTFKIKIHSHNNANGHAVMIVYHNDKVLGNIYSSKFPGCCGIRVVHDIKLNIPADKPQKGDPRETTYIYVLGPSKDLLDEGATYQGYSAKEVVLSLIKQLFKLHDWDTLRVGTLMFTDRLNTKDNVTGTFLTKHFMKTFSSLPELFTVLNKFTFSNPRTLNIVDAMAVVPKIKEIQ